MGDEKLDAMTTDISRRVLLQREGETCRRLAGHGSKVKEVTGNFDENSFSG